MWHHDMMGGEGEDRKGSGPVGTATEPVADATAPSESQIRDDELYRMAAFRIRETANRIATLANSAQDKALREELVSVFQRLLDEERALLTRTRSGSR